MAKNSYINVRLEDDLMEWLERYAAELEVSVSEVVRRTLRASAGLVPKTLSTQPEEPQTTKKESTADAW